MSRKVLALAVAAALVAPVTAGAAEVLGKQLEIYGRAHVSLDFVDNDTESDMAIASNSSRLGFKGVTAINDNLDALYQIESKIIFDEGGDNKFAGRNTFVGLGGAFGKVLVGNQDTPLKGVRGAFDLFGDTVGDARNIMNQANFRAKNSIQYITPNLNGFSAKAMYATAYQDAEHPGGIENNDTSLYSVAIGYKVAGLTLAAGYESAEALTPADEVEGIRVAANYWLGPVRVGATYEQIEIGSDDRDAYGVNAAYKFGDATFKMQYVVADDVSGVADSGASQLTVGLDYKLAKHTTIYGAYNLLENDDNASSYQIKGGHDTDVYSVVNPGDEISAFSIGLIHNF